MYSTCLYCTKDLGANEVLETLPIGRRIVFDSTKGRLWVVCRSCSRWNLVPFDTRLETIDACERIFSDTRTRFSTENIGLARVREGLDLVRIGAPQRPEFASWRYGAQYARRRRITLALAGAGAVAGAAALFGVESVGLLTSGVVGGMWQVPHTVWKIIRNSRRRVIVRLPDSVAATRLKADQIESAHLDLSDDDMRLHFFGPGRYHRRHATAVVRGEEARLAARRVMGALNDMVGSSEQLAHAIRRLETHEMTQWIRECSNRAVSVKAGNKAIFGYQPPNERWNGFGEQSLRLGALLPADRLAIEMWLSEEDEAKALAGELSLLERQWKDADELASIADSLALPDDIAHGRLPT